jgi:hypothetical protein
VKLNPLLATPPTVMTTSPVAALLGTVTPTLPSLQDVAVAATPPKVTVLLPMNKPKFDPLIVTGAYAAADPGDIDEIVGACAKVENGNRAAASASHSKRVNPKSFMAHSSGSNSIRVASL